MKFTHRIDTAGHGCGEPGAAHEATNKSPSAATVVLIPIR